MASRARTNGGRGRLAIVLAVALLLTLLGTGASTNGASNEPADDRPSILVTVIDT